MKSLISTRLAVVPDELVLMIAYVVMVVFLRVEDGRVQLLLYHEDQRRGAIQS